MKTHRFPSRMAGAVAGWPLAGGALVLLSCIAFNVRAQRVDIDPVSTAAGQRYEAVALPHFPGFPIPRVSSVNNRGHVAGTNYACPFILSCLSKTLLYDGSELIHTSEEVIASVPPGFVGVPVSLDLNDNDQAVIRLAVPDLGLYHYLWDNGETTLISADPNHDPQNPGPLVPFTPPPGTAWAVNNHGVVVGSVHSGQPGSEHSQAFLWNRNEGVMALIDPPPGFSSIGARGINSHNHIVGAVGGAAGRAYIWKNGEFTILPPLPGHVESQALAVNDDGLIVGTSLAPPTGNFVYSLVMWQNGRIVDSVSLNFPGGLLLAPLDINARGDVVGYYWPTAVAAQQFGFRWSAASGFADLNGSIANIAGVNIWSAEGINDAGQIAIWGEYPGFTGAAFLLTPIPPLPGDINGDGTVGVADLLAVITAWGPCPAPPGSCPADVAPSGGDGSVGVADLLLVISNWG